MPTPDGPFRYVAYGLRVASAFPLRDVRAGSAGGDVDVTIRRGDVRAQSEREPRPGCFDADPERIFLWHPRAGGVLAQGGRSLTVERVPDADDDLLHTILMGQGFASLLLQRGRSALHASAVAVDGRAVAFFGEKGAGKSTTAAAFVRAGHPLVTDDLLVWSGGPDRPLAHPGYGLVKLWGPSVRAHELESDAEPPSADAFPKWVWSVDPADRPLPLRAVYLLEFGDALRAERLSRPKAFVALSRHSFAGALAEVACQRRPHSQDVARLASRVPVFRLERPRDLSQMGALVSYVIQCTRA